ncbi:MAG: GNAT family N-acetyltransferase [bacterium]
MSDILITEYSDKDKAEICILFNKFGEYLKNLDQKYLKLLIVPEGYGESWHNMMINDVKEKRGKIYVLRDNNKIIGFISGVIFDVGNSKDEKDCKPHRMGRVTELYVDEAYRGKGLGSKLIAEIERYFRIQNCFKVNIEVFGPNQSAYNFYKKHGYTDRNYDLAKVL